MPYRAIVAMGSEFVPIRGKIFDIPAYAATFPARGLPTFLAYICAGGIFRRHCSDPWPCYAICRVGDDCVYAGRDFQLAPVLGIH